MTDVPQEMNGFQALPVSNETTKFQLFFNKPPTTCPNLLCINFRWEEMDFLQATADSQSSLLEDIYIPYFLVEPKRLVLPFQPRKQPSCGARKDMRNDGKSQKKSPFLEEEYCEEEEKKCWMIKVLCTFKSYSMKLKMLFVI